MSKILMRPSTRVWGLYPNQYAILFLFMVALVLGMDWGLPDETRMQLLTHELNLSNEDKEKLSSQREEFYEKVEEELDTLSEKALQGEAEQLDSAYQLQQGQYDAVLTEAQKITVFRSFILGSGATDERKTFSALSRMNPGALDLDPRIYIYGGAYLYPLGAVLFAMKSLGALEVSSDMAFYLEQPQHIARMYIAGRSFNVFAFLGTLALLGWLGNRWKNQLAGTFAMLAYGLGPVALYHAVVAKPHGQMTFLVLLAFVLLYLYCERRSLLLLLCSGIAMGLAIGSTLSSAVFLLIYPLILGGHQNRVRTLKLTAMVGFAAWVAYSITNPYTYLNFSEFYLTLAQHGAGDKSGYGFAVINFAKMGNYFSQVFFETGGLPLAIIALVMMVHESVFGEPHSRKLAWVTLFLMLFFSLSIGNMRLSMFLLPFLALYAGLGTAHWFGEVGWHPLALKASWLVILIHGLVLGFVLCFEMIYNNQWQNDTRRWVEQTTFTEDTVIGVLNRPDSTEMIPFPFLESPVINLAEYEPGVPKPDYIVKINNRYDEAVWETLEFKDEYTLTAILGTEPPSWGWNYPIQFEQINFSARVYQRQTQ